MNYKQKHLEKLCTSELFFLDTTCLHSSAGRYCHLDPQLTILKKIDDITKYHDIIQKAKSKNLMINHLSLLYHILLTSFLLTY